MTKEDGDLAEIIRRYGSRSLVMNTIVDERRKEYFKYFNIRVRPYEDDLLINYTVPSMGVTKWVSTEAIGLFIFLKGLEHVFNNMTGRK